MYKFKKKLSLLLYYLVANKLPSSYFPFGGSFNWMRNVLVKNFLVIGSNCKLQPKVNLGDGNDIIIGSDCIIMENVYIQGAVIGNCVMIAANVAILAKFHNYDRIDVPMIFQGSTQESPCFIDDDVWIGRNVVIMPGIKIGKGSIVGAGAVVTTNVEPYSIVAGVPAKLIRKRT